MCVCVCFSVYTMPNKLNIYCLFRRGSMLSTAIFVYAATSPVNGYFGGSLYSRMGGMYCVCGNYLMLILCPDNCVM